jgi:transposase-like protein
MKKQDRIKRLEGVLSFIERWHESGKTQKAFCQEHDLTITTFYYWLRRYRRGNDENSFLAVEIVPDPTLKPGAIFATNIQSKILFLLY